MSVEEGVVGSGRVPRMAAICVGALAVCALASAVSPAVAGDWRIGSLNGAAPLEAPELRFEADGSFSGSTGCNRFQGQIQFEENELIVDGPVATTRMACPGGAMTAQDDTIIALFSGRISVAFDPTLDVLVLTTGETVLELTPAAATDAGPFDGPRPHAGLEPPAGTPPYLNPFGMAEDMPIHAAPDAASEIVGGAYPGQILRNEGCEGDWCRVTMLDASVSGWGQSQSLEASDSALRAGQGVFDATGVVPCANGKGAPMAQCAFGVARDGGGNATLAVTRSDGLVRALFFADGELFGADTSEADGGHEFSAAREGDLLMIRVNDERYEIPDAAIFGG